jgi:hypothetical protein
LSDVTSVNSPLPQLSISTQFIPSENVFKVINHAASTVTLSIIGTSGSLIAMQHIPPASDYSFPLHLAKGIYFCKATDGNSQHFVTKFSVN